MGLASGGGAHSVGDPVNLPPVDRHGQQAIEVSLKRLVRSCRRWQLFWLQQWICESCYPLGMHLRLRYRRRNQIAPLRVDSDGHCSRLGRRRVGAFGAALVLALAAQAGAAADPSTQARDHLAKAIEQIEAERYSLARTYLEPVLVSPWITARQRSRAFFYRGFTFAAEEMYVSAALDYVRALEFQPSLPQALSGLAHLRAEGLGIVRDEAAAFRYALKAARGGDGAARVRVGVSYLPSDVAKARYWLQAAADQGFVPAYVHLARSWRRASTDAPDPDAARRWYELAEREGQVEATLALGYMFRDGEFGTADPAQAARRFERAAEGGSGHAMVALAHLHLVGEGVARDLRRAGDLYADAAHEGIAAAFTGLGHLSERAGDPALAERWYRRGAEANEPPSQYRLARMMLADEDDGRLEEAVHWLQRAAGAGHPEAESAAAWILATSTRAELRNGPLAVHLAERAVAQSEDADTLDTLAAAWAEQGEFARAVEAQRRALEFAATNERQRAELQRHLASYEAERPWRE